MGILDKIRSGLSRTRKSFTGLLDSFTGANDEFFDELEESLILADMGAELAVDTVDELRERAKHEGLHGGAEIRAALKESLTAALAEAGDTRLHLETKPSVILVIGVNGVGKTTTIGKLAARFTGEGKKVLLCAGADLVRHEEGSDPGAVVFDGITAAKARGTDVLICDTAGRLHNKTNLMNELGKISRIIDRELPDCSRENLLVLDAGTGQNGLIQARQFSQSAGVTGLVLTKLDGTAKGGIAFAVNRELGIPVKFIGVGEQVDDLLEFDPEAFVEAMLS